MKCYVVVNIYDRLVGRRNTQAREVQSALPDSVHYSIFDGVLGVAKRERGGGLTDIAGLKTSMISARKAFG